MNAPVNPLNHSTATYLELRNRLAKIYDLENDDPVLLDTLEGASDLSEQIGAVLREAKATEAMMEGLGMLADAMMARRARLHVKAESLRSAALWALLETQQTKLTLPDMTVSVSPGKPRMAIDMDTLPPTFKMSKPLVYIADREFIQQRIDEGYVPDGVTIEPPKPFLTIRTR